MSKNKLNQALEEVNSIHFGSSNKTVSIVISSDGGNAVSAVDFVCRLNGLPLKYEVKIYEASSAAAYIALAIGSELEMSKSATLSIHRGGVTLGPTEIDKEGKVSKPILEGLRKYDTALIETMKNFNFSECTDELYATDWLRLPAEECLKRGIVQRLF